MVEVFPFYGNYSHSDSVHDFRFDLWRRRDSNRRPAVLNNRPAARPD